MTIDKIKETLINRAMLVDFEAENHTYTYKGKQLTSVSDTQSFFTSRYGEMHPSVYEKYILPAQKRGTEIHSFMEQYVFFSKNRENIEKRYKDHEYWEYLEKGMNEWDALEKDGYKPLAVEQLLFNPTDKIAGTVDLIAYKDNTLLIVDWKTGALKIENYAQIGIYAYLLENSLRGFKNTGWEVKTYLSCLK